MRAKCNSNFEVLHYSSSHKKRRENLSKVFENTIVIILFHRGMITRTKVQMFSYDQLFQAYQKDKFVLVSELLIYFRVGETSKLDTVGDQL